MKLQLVLANEVLAYQMRLRGIDPSGKGIGEALDQYISEQSITAYRAVSENNDESKDNPSYLIFTVTLPKRIDMSFSFLPKKLTISLINYNEEILDWFERQFEESSMEYSKDCIKVTMAGKESSWPFQEYLPRNVANHQEAVATSNKPSNESESSRREESSYDSKTYRGYSSF